MDGSNRKQTPQRTALSKAWKRVNIPLAQWLHNWQGTVSIRTRNRWVLSVMGLILLYGLFTIITLFF